MILYIIILSLSLFVLYFEGREYSVSFKNRDFFDVKNSRLCRDNIISDSDNVPSCFSKLKNIILYNNEFVFWRVCFIISLLTSILIYIVVYKTFPDEWSLFTYMLCIFIISYFVLNFYLFHIHKDVSNIINNNISILMTKL
jgi:hypothetical protein